MPTAHEHALQMVAQLRVLDPSMSAEIGTPERKLVDTVAQALYDNAIDLDALSAGLDLDSKYGAQLDRFLNIFGFRRQRATFAQGFVTFSRVTPATSDTRIPAATLVRAPALEGEFDAQDFTEAHYATTFDVTLPAGETSVIAPVRAVVAGVANNVAAGRVTMLVGVVPGITAVTNVAAIEGGRDVESDEEFKVRFKNTVFRNLAGTEDQYLALAIATAFSSKANVIGPQSHYREYVQVPPVDDATAYDVHTTGGATEAGNGVAGEYSTALSTLPYAKYVYGVEHPVFVSNGRSGIGSYFFRQGVDFRLNTTAAARNIGDAYRFFNTGADPQLDIDPLSSTVRPNVTFMNVYTGADADIQSIRPGDIVLLEYSYLSGASRNDLDNNISNAVDVFVDGGNDTLATNIVSRPTSLTAFVDNPLSAYHYENYRRTGDVARRPLVGNVLMPLLWQPVLDVPEEIIIGDDTFYRDVHYWAVEEVSSVGGTVRARSGLEWSTQIKGRGPADPVGDVSLYTGKIILDPSGDPLGGRPIEIADYVYDRNIRDLQAALDGAKQVTTDVLAHRAKIRYFKLDITVMYSEGASVLDTNLAIRDAVDVFLRSQYFGSAIQLSDILQVVHSISGVDNVRWSADAPAVSEGTPRVIETNRNGDALLGITSDRVIPGAAAVNERQRLYLVGRPTSGAFRLTNGTNTTANLDFDATAGEIQTALGAAFGSPTVTEDTRSTDGVLHPIMSFTVNLGTVGARALIIGALPTSALPLRGGDYVIGADFFLLDDELARLANDTTDLTAELPDTLPGLIIRPRAQNTWTRWQ